MGAREGKGGERDIVGIRKVRAGRLQEDPVNPTPPRRQPAARCSSPAAPDKVCRDLHAPARPAPTPPLPLPRRLRGSGPRGAKELLAWGIARVPNSAFTLPGSLDTPGLTPDALHIPTPAT
ncbi:hypothetical protein O3P69_001032 [Scylla paramamosain]|uniref:Uncharacterized protein n=1 Tax=Scylla paramamosain TaxID=85552 RepID=A0AAW0UQY6_SCYPA